MKRRSYKLVEPYYRIANILGGLAMSRYDEAEKVLNLVDRVTALVNKLDANWGKYPAVFVMTDQGMPFYGDDAIIPEWMSPLWLSRPLEIATLAETSDAHGSYFALVQTTEVTDWRSTRGKIVKMAPYIAKIEIATLEESAKVTDTWAGHVGFFGERKWENISQANQAGSRESYGYAEYTNPARLSPRMGVLCGQQFAYEYFWSVTVGYRRGIHARLPTDAVGVKAFLEMRDKGSGMQRRSAMLHWVEEHWRTLVRDPETETMVRRHFRGRESYGWGDMDGEIIPPAVAVTDAAEAVKERESVGQRPRTSPQDRMAELRAKHLERAAKYRSDWENRVRGAMVVKDYEADVPAASINQ